MSSSGGASRIELESQILCAALRQSWADTDWIGVVKAREELVQLFPDLAPDGGLDWGSNFYALFEIECDVNPSMVNAAYLKKVKKFLREHPNPTEAKDEYYAILNAGYILRIPRLRLSHDMLVCKSWLDEFRFTSEAVTIDFTPPPPVVPEKSGGEKDMTLGPSQGLEERLPMLIDLLKAAQIIGPAEVQALKNQMSLYPDIALVDLVLQAGYVTDLEMKSLQLAEYLLKSGKITLGQFAIDMFDERTSGPRIKQDPEDNDEGVPPAKARVPKKPKPSGDTNNIKLVEPKPPEPDPDNPKI